MAKFFSVLGVEHWRIAAGGGLAMVGEELFVAAFEDVELGVVQCGVAVVEAICLAQITQHAWSALDAKLAVENGNLSSSGVFLLRSVGGSRPVKVVVNLILGVKVPRTTDMAAVEFVWVSCVHHKKI